MTVRRRFDQDYKRLAKCLVENSCYQEKVLKIKNTQPVLELKLGESSVFFHTTIEDPKHGIGHSVLEIYIKPDDFRDGSVELFDLFNFLVETMDSFMIINVDKDFNQLRSFILNEITDKRYNAMESANLSGNK